MSREWRNPDPEVGSGAVDYASLLREKVAELRAEIAQLRELSAQYRRRGLRDAAGMEADLRRQARLDEIKVELTRLAKLGRSTPEGKSIEPSRKPFLVRKAS